MTKYHMDLEYVDAELLREHPRNPKRHTNQQLQNLSNSISRFSWTQPIVVDEQNTILVGHGRWRAIGGKGRIQVVRLLGLTERSKLKLMVVDNKIQQRTGFDPISMEQVLTILEKNHYPLAELGLIAEVLGETGARGEDQNKLKESFDRYLKGETKRLVLYYAPSEFEKVEHRIDVLMTDEEIPMRCDLVMTMLLEYEREHGKLDLGE